jgi:ketosteroid isomerase-like protein
MHRQISSRGFVLLAALCAACVTRPTPSAIAERGSAANDQQAIRDRLRDWVIATNAGDHARANDIWEADVQGWFPQDAAYTPAAAAAAAGADASITGRSTYEVTIDEVLVSGDLAVVRDTWRETRRFNGGSSATRTIRSFEVWRRQPDGAWRIARWISAPDRWSARP